MQLAFIPIYIRYLGMEAYGLIGIFAMLQAWLTLLDMGMTPTLNREMARFTAGAHTSESIRDLVRSLEMLSLVVAFLIVVGIWSASGWFSLHWLRVDKLPLQTVSEAIAIMGLVAGMRIIEGVYRGALLGLQTQVWVNAASAILATIRGVGAVGILYWVSPTIQAFFIWQACMSLLTLIIFGFRVHHSLPAPMRRARFSQQALADIWHFARGMIITTLLSLMLMQVDRLLLSRLLSLENFGAYTLAATVANALGLLIVPISQSYYPKFTELLTRDDRKGLVAAYHQGAQLMTVMLVPATLILVFHSEFLLALWTGNSALANSAATLVSLLAIGTAFNGLMHIPYMLQLAYGWSSLAAKVNLVAVAILIPVLFWAVPRYGAIGAAWVWVSVNAGYIFIAVHFMYRRLIPKEKNAWYWRDITLPALAASSVSFLGEWLYPMNSSQVTQLMWLMATGVAAFVLALLAAPDLRKSVLYALKRKNFA